MSCVKNVNREQVLTASHSPRRGLSNEIIKQYIGNQ